MLQVNRSPTPIKQAKPALRPNRADICLSNYRELTKSAFTQTHLSSWHYWTPADQSKLQLCTFEDKLNFELVRVVKLPHAPFDLERRRWPSTFGTKYPQLVGRYLHTETRRMEMHTTKIHIPTYGKGRIPDNRCGPSRRQASCKLMWHFGHCLNWVSGTSVKHVPNDKNATLELLFENR